MSDSDRKAEIERKRAKLEQIRQQRKQDESAKKQAPAAVSANDKTLNDLLKGLDIGSRSSPKPSPQVPADQQSNGVASPPNSNYVTPSQTLASMNEKKKAPTLCMTSVMNEVSIAPSNVVSYTKEVQTTGSSVFEGNNESRPGVSPSRLGSPKLSNLEWDDDEFMPSWSVCNQVITSLGEDGDDLEEDDGGLALGHKRASVAANRLSSSSERQVGGAEGHNEQEASSPSQKSSGSHTARDSSSQIQSSSTVVPAEAKQLSEEEKDRIWKSDHFQNFMKRATKIIERALTQDDIFVDYASREIDPDAPIDFCHRAKHVHTFFMEDLLKNRKIEAIDWSPSHPELCLAAYSNPVEFSSEPEGLVCVWNTKFRTPTPEFTLYCESSVRTACFASFHPNIVLGGTFSGQLVMWDMRVPKRAPVHRTLLSSVAHTYPVTSIKVVGTQNAHNLISSSNDGRICTWALDMLSSPQDKLELLYKNKPIHSLCLSFFQGDVNNFVVGSSDATIYSACRHGNQPGIIDAFGGHKFPCSVIDCHRANQSAQSGDTSAAHPIDFSHLFLSCASNWDMKLWSSRRRKPLHSFSEAMSFTSDVQWSPSHPAMFATCDTTHKVNLWNLNHDTWAPTCSFQVGDTGVTPDPPELPPMSGASLSKLAWNTTGSLIAVGSTTGYLHLIEVHESLAHPKSPDDWTAFQQVLTEMQLQTDEAAHLHTSMTGGLSANASSLISAIPVTS